VSTQSLTRRSIADARAEFAADYAAGRRSGRKTDQEENRMSEELDNPRVLKRLAWSIPAGLLAAAAGAALAMAIHPLLVSLHIKFFTGCGAFLWIELGALIFAVVGFTWMWKRLTP